MVGHFSTYIYQKRGFYDLSRRVPKDVQPLHGKQRIVLAPDKWLPANFRQDIVIHGFRHAMRDRLRAVNCPSEMIDQIGGWSSGKVGEGYGERYATADVTRFLRLLGPTSDF
ncbi:MAG: hypothetical protein ACON4I_08365 [Candidatus Puniceispirillaceae bacterium]